MSHYPKHVMRRVIGQNEKYKNGSSANLKVANSTMADIKMNNFSFDDPKYVYNKHTAQDEGNTGCQNTNGPVQEVMSSDYESSQKRLDEGSQQPTISSRI